MIPLTVIGGFLGSGKTTLVNHLLANAPVRYGVLVNDFGAIAVDAALIAARNSTTLALTNGCVCCTMGDDLGGGLLQLANAGIEHALIEASGISDPWRLAQLALVEPGFSLEPIVVLADASAIADHVDDRWVADTVRGQIAAADLIVLNKADSPSLPRAQAVLGALRPGVPIMETIQAALPVEVLRFPAPSRARFHADAPPDHAFRTVTLPDSLYDRDRLRAVLSALPRSVLRVKGFCRLDDGPDSFLLQYAAGQWALTPCSGPPGLVVIGTPEMPDAAQLFAAAYVQ